ncbi:MAG: gene transfer agent family protein [Gammaproteobacteria bacterium]|nr:gene transfer agent family protein [Gammaproteobacteria bacterium]
MRGEIIDWVGGEHTFALDLPRLEALQARCNDDGIGLIHHRLQAGLFRVQDVMATVALGLEGGGMERRAAVNLVRRLYEDHGLDKLAIVANTLLSLARYGWPGGDISGGGGVETPKTSSLTPKKT